MSAASSMKAGRCRKAIARAPLLPPFAGEGAPTQSGRMRVLATLAGLLDHLRGMRRFTDHQLARARHLRREMTRAETILWRCLRDRGIGAKFRRQVPIGPYVGDFVCVGARIIVELDGPPHEKSEQQTHDRRRDQWLRAKGWCVLRFSNDLVIGDGEIVLQEIGNAIAAASSPSSAHR
ncbi:MAG: endonuclease domain-containing protein [Hyphomicrobiales bacterium]